MPFNKNFENKPRILIVGGGYVGLYTALGLQKKLKDKNTIVTLVDPSSYMTYQPFLPEVAGGNIEARHTVVPHNAHLKKTEIIAGKVTQIDHKKRIAHITIGDSESFELPYEEIVMAAGAVTRTFPIPGLSQHGIGMKTIEEAVAVRNQVLDNIEIASTATSEIEKKKSLTFVVVGGGFAGIETIAEIEDMARTAVKRNPRLEISDLRFILVEAMGRIMPEVTEKQAIGVVEHLRGRGIEVMLNTSLADASNKSLKLVSVPDNKPVETVQSNMLIWTAGVMANPLVRNTDFPLDDRGRIRAAATLQIVDGDIPVGGAWTAGDISAVPDLTGGGVGGFCVPNAQHALRQTKVLVANIVASRNQKNLREYSHKNLGAVAGLGLYKGVAKIGGLRLKGFPAWMMHRGYHGMAMPTFERKARVTGGWFTNWVWGRDTAILRNIDSPRTSFVEHAIYVEETLVEQKSSTEMGTSKAVKNQSSLDKNISKNSGNKGKKNK